MKTGKEPNFSFYQYSNNTFNFSDTLSIFYSVGFLCNYWVVQYASFFFKKQKKILKGLQTSISGH